MTNAKHLERVNYEWGFEDAAVGYQLWNPTSTDYLRGYTEGLYYRLIKAMHRLTKESQR